MSDDYRELLIGCGASRLKKLSVGNQPNWRNLTTLDNNPDHQPDVLWDLMNTSLPFPDNAFNEIHAYEVLEHTGRQGDYQFFFAQFSDFWRILRPGGFLIGTAPMFHSPWAWGDPSHSRIINKECFVYLDQDQYIQQVGKTAMSDFRYLYQADFVLAWMNVDQQPGNADQFQFCLQAVKPSRCQRPLVQPATAPITSSAKA